MADNRLSYRAGDDDSGYRRCRGCGRLFEPTRTDQEYCQRACWRRTDSTRKTKKRRELR